MQGLFIRGRRPASKAELRRTLASGPAAAGDIRVEGTSLFTEEFVGPLSKAPVGTRIDFVGPDPYTDRKFYGRIAVTDKGIKLS